GEQQEQGRGRWGLAAIGRAQPRGKRLQELPPNGPIPLDERAEFPERDPVTNQIRGCRHRGGAGAAVDQGSLTEVVTRAEGGELYAFAGNRGLSGVDQEKGGASGAFHDHGLALGEGPDLEQASDLLGLPAIHVCEELNALECGDRVARRRARRRRVAAGFAGSDGATLEGVEGAILERPFDVAPRAVDLLALEGKVAQGPE